MLKVFERPPEEFLHHIAVTVFVRVGKGVAARRNRPANRRQLRGMVPQRVANVIESDRMGQLGEKKTYHMTPWREGPRLLVHPVLSGKFIRQVGRDKLANLMKCAGVMFGRRWFFHPSDSLVGIRRRPTFLAQNQGRSTTSYGMAVKT